MNADSDQRVFVSEPYVGPRPFRSAEADRFFGRHREALDIRSVWPAERVVVLHGQDGIGKTSLLNAGVLPLLISEGEIDLLPVGRLVHQSARPLASDRPDDAYRYTLLSSWAPFDEPSPVNTTICEFLSARPRLANARNEPFSVLAAIDQFEELFTAYPADDRHSEQLIDELGEALREIEALSLLLIIRDDHLATLSQFESRLSPYPVVYRRLEALDIESAVEAITGPLTDTNRSFAPKVVEGLVERLRTFSYTDRLLQKVTLKRDRVEPLDLQIACARLWTSLPPEVDIITHEYLQAFGDPGQAAADFYDAAIREVHNRTHEPEEDLRNWIENTFITEWGTRGTALRGITTTANVPNSIADAFADLRVLAQEYRNLSTWYQLGQDRLIGAVQRANGEWREAHSISLVKPSSVQMPADYRAAAEAALSSGDFDQAQRLIAIAVDGYRRAKDTRGLAYAFELQGEIARVKGNTTAAEQSIRRALYEFAALEDTPAQARLLSALGDAYSAAGDYVKAAQFHRQASEQLPADVDALTGLGYAQWYLGSPADAEATFTRALDWNRNESRALAGRGQVRVELRQYRQALDDLNRALGLELSLDSEIDARSALAVVLADLGRAEDADRELRAARFQDPERPRTRLRAGRVDVALGRPERARHELKEALRAHPPLPPADESIARELLDGLHERN